MKRPSFVLSLCGTSCLANLAGEHRRLVIQHANVLDPTQIPYHEREELQGLINKVRHVLATANLEGARKNSAEINSLAAFYAGDIARGKDDQHFLIHTDTWLGKEAAECVKGFLSRHIGFVELVKFGGLRTDSMLNFRAALGEMARWCEENIPKNQMHVVFNLTGGFKSVQGFMQTLGLFYADERIYLFESSDELLRIPRLPVRMDAAEEVKRYLRPIRRLACGLCPEAEVPELYALEIDGEATLSEWGEIIWQQEKPRIYRERLWPEISRRFRYGDTFKKDAESLPPDRKAQLNRRMDELALFLERDDHPNPKSLNIKPLKGNLHPPCTHELRAWSDRDAKRIFGWFDGDTFIVECLEKHP